MTKTLSAPETLLSQIERETKKKLLLGIISALYETANEKEATIKTISDFFSKAKYEQLGKELLLELERQSKSPAQTHFRTPKERAAFYVQRLFYTFA